MKEHSIQEAICLIQKRKDLLALIELIKKDTGTFKISSRSRYFWPESELFLDYARQHIEKRIYNVENRLKEIGLELEDNENDK